MQQREMKIKQKVEAIDDYFLVRHEHDSDEYLMHADVDEYHSCDSSWELLAYKIDSHLDVDAWFECDVCHELIKVNYQYRGTETYEEIGIDNPFEVKNE